MRWDNLLHEMGRSVFVLVVSEGFFDSRVLLRRRWSDWQEFKNGATRSRWLEA